MEIIAGRPAGGPSRAYVSLLGVIVVLIVLLVIGLLSGGGGGSHHPTAKKSTRPHTRHGARSAHATLSTCKPVPEDALRAALATVPPGETITLKKVATDRTQLICELDTDAKALLPSDTHARDSVSRLLKADMSRLKSYLEEQVGPMHAI